MRKLFKYFGIFIGSLLLLLIATAVIVPLVVDINDYKPRIEQLAGEATGRELEIIGDIELSLFPWIGAEIGEIRIGNAAGFDDQDFAELQSAEVRVKLLPLLAREVVVDQIVIESPVVRLQRNANGVGNWEDLAKGDAEGAADSDAAEGRPALEKLDIGGLSLSNARFMYDDQASGMSARLANLDVELGSVGLPVDTRLNMGGTFSLNESDNESGVEGSFTLSTGVYADLESQLFSLRDGLFVLTLKGSAIPLDELESETGWQELAADLDAATADVRGVTVRMLGTDTELEASVTNLLESPQLRGSINLAADDLEKTGAALGDLVPAGVALAGKASAGMQFAYDQSAGTATLSDIMIDAMGVQAGINADVTGLPEEPRITGQLDIAEFSPVRLMSRLGIELPQTSDDTVLEKASLKSAFKTSPTAASLADLNFMLDDSNLTGRVEIADFERQALRFDLTLDGIDVDRYLPPAAQDVADDEEAGGDINAIEIPVEPLRGLDIVGRMTIGQMKAVGFRSRDIKIGVNAKDDALRIHPATAKFYEGGYRGDIRVDASGDAAKFSIDEHLKTVQLGPLLQDVFDVTYVSGSAQMDFAATATGKTVGDIRKSLNGSMAANIKDGTLEGFNLWESIRKAYATVQGKPYEAEDTEERTRFTELSASGKIHDGVFRNEKLDMRLPFLRVGGKGDIDLVEETLDYRVDAKIVSSVELEGGMEDLRGITIPIRLTGPLASPKVRPELDEALKAKAREELERKKAEAKAEAQRRLEEEKRKLEEKRKKAEEEAKEKAEDKLKDKIKGLFD